jgi:hypothetical protein
MHANNFLLKSHDTQRVPQKKLFKKPWQFLHHVKDLRDKMYKNWAGAQPHLTGLLIPVKPSVLGFTLH